MWWTPALPENGCFLSPSEPLQQETVSLFRQLVEGQFSLIVPDFFCVEVANVLCKAIRTGR
jgi:hypothetical protein